MRKSPYFSLLKPIIYNSYMFLFNSVTFEFFFSWEGGRGRVMACRVSCSCPQRLLLTSEKLPLQGLQEMSRNVVSMDQNQLPITFPFFNGMFSFFQLGIINLRWWLKIKLHVKSINLQNNETLRKGQNHLRTSNVFMIRM